MKMVDWKWWRGKKKTATELESADAVQQANKQHTADHTRAWVCWKCGLTHHGFWPYEGEIKAHSAEGVKNLCQWVPLCQHCVEDEPDHMQDSFVDMHGFVDMQQHPAGRYPGSQYAEVQLPTKIVAKGDYGEDRT